MPTGYLDELRSLGGDDPGGGRGEHSVGREIELGESLAEVGRDLGADLVDSAFPEAKHLARRAQRHVELDRVVEVPADLERQVAALQRDLLEAGDLELLADRVGICHRKRARPTGRLFGLL